MGFELAALVKLKSMSHTLSNTLTARLSDNEALHVAAIEMLLLVAEELEPHAKPADRFTKSVNKD